MVFLDTNIFVYLLDAPGSEKREKADQIVQTALRDSQGIISYQVVQETLNVITRKARRPAEIPDAAAFMREFLLPLWTILPTRGLYERALSVQSRYGYGFYDSLIVAAGLIGGCSKLYSEDLQDGQQIEQMKIVNPFKA